MKTKTFVGRAVAMAVLDAETVDTVRLTYKLRTAKLGSSAKSFGGYQTLILLNADLQYEEADQLLGTAIRMVKCGKCDDGSIIFPDRAAALSAPLSIDLDWRVEAYYNDADMITDISKGSYPYAEMIVLFPRSLSRKKRLLALRAAEKVLSVKGLPKGIVALGNDSFATVYMKEGVYADWW